MSRRVVHRVLDIKSALTNTLPGHWDSFVLGAEGRFLSAHEVRVFLLDELAKGRKFIALEPCAGFDPAIGCPEHDEGGPG